MLNWMVLFYIWTTKCRDRCIHGRFDLNHLGHCFQVPTACAGLTCMRACKRACAWVTLRSRNFAVAVVHLGAARVHETGVNGKLKWVNDKHGNENEKLTQAVYTGFVRLSFSYCKTCGLARACRVLHRYAHTYARRQRRIHTMVRVYLYGGRVMIKVCGIYYLCESSWWSWEGFQAGILISSTPHPILSDDFCCGDHKTRYHFVFN